MIEDTAANVSSAKMLICFLRRCCSRSSGRHLCSDLDSS